MSKKKNGKEEELRKALKALGLSKEQIDSAIEKAKETFGRTVNRSAMGKIVTHCVGLHRLTNKPLSEIAKVVTPIEHVKITITPVKRSNGTVIYVPLSSYDDDSTITAKELVALCEELIEKQSKQ